MHQKAVGHELLKKIRAHVQNGTYVLAKHAIERQIERHINLAEVLYVLKYGFHEESKDLFEVKRQAWKYAVRGKTTHGIEIRVIVSFENEMVIITVMRIKK